MADSDSDDDLGPKPANYLDDKKKRTMATEVEPPKKRVKKSKPTMSPEIEKLYLDELPSSEYYEHSYMHRDIVTHVCVSKATEFIITGSSDGHIKFWKKMPKAIEFVKHYQAHLGPINDMKVSFDEKILVSTSNDQYIKFFEILGFDMTNMIKVDYTPNIATWLTGPQGINDRVAISDSQSGLIRVYRVDGDEQALQEIQLHSHPIV